MWWFLEHARKAFDEMPMRTRLPLDSILAVIISHVSWLALIVVFLYVSVVPNQFLRAGSFPIAMQSWTS
jgi:hypothetical protein